MIRLLHGDCLDVLPTLDACSIDSIVTDPPYGLSFMSKDWDRGIPGEHFWREVIRVAKPGANLLSFGGTRTHHRLMCAIEDAGWELRDTLGWIFGSGFPKSANGEWGGSALKPAWEPIIMARKPLHGTLAANFAKWGTGGLNIADCRIDWDEESLEKDSIRRRGKMTDIRGGNLLNGKPFMGSGSTLKEAELEGFSAIGIEKEAEYVEIARRRIASDIPLFAA